MKLKRRPYIIASQVFIMLAFFVGILVNYSSLEPIISSGEDYRIMTDIDSYVWHFLPENDCDVRDQAQLDSVLALNLNPYEGQFYIMDARGEFIYAQDGSAGDALEILGTKYGKVASDLIRQEYENPTDRSRVDYDSDTHYSMYASFNVLSGLMFFYAVDYHDAGHDILRTFILLSVLMAIIGILVLVAGYLITRKIIAQERKDLLVQKALDTASAIQKEMLPHGEEHYVQIDVDARLIPANKVGGDFYSYILIDGMLYFCIGDVSGKGIPASLFMSKAVTLFRVLAKSRLSPASLASSMNAELCENNEQNMFMTGILGTISPLDGTVVYVNAGHELPIVWDGKEKSELRYLDSAGNLPFGVIPEFEYEEEHHVIETNGLFLLYTDGVSEAKSGSQGLLGRNAILRLIEPDKSLTSKQINDNLLKHISDYESGVEQSDDITLLTFRNINSPKRLSITNDVAELRKLPSFMEALFRECPLDSRERILIRSGVDEAMTNCVQYAYEEPGQKIDLIAALDHRHVTFAIEDSGKPFNPLEHKPEPSDGLKVGGLGISMYKKAFDEIIYTREDNRNILKLIKNL